MSPKASTKTYHTEKLSDEPIIFVELFSDYNIVRDLPKSGAESIKLLNTQTEPVFYIIDTSALNINVNDVINAANMASGSENALYRHPMIREIVYVTDSTVVEIGARGLDSEAFGNVKARVVPSLDDALAYARANK